MKNLHLLLPQCFVFDETLTICTLKLVTPYKCVYFRPCKSQSSMLWFIAFKYSCTCTCIHSGYVLANRLSEDPGTSVLIVEIGGSEDDNPMMSFPFQLLPCKLHNKTGRSEWPPQKRACLGFEHKVRIKEGVSRTEGQDEL